MPKSFGLFIPREFGFAPIVAILLKELNFHEVEPTIRAAKRMLLKTSETSFIRIWEESNPDQHIEESGCWDWLPQQTLQLLPNTVVITVEFDNDDWARAVLIQAAKVLKDVGGRAVLDNDFGVLLKMSDVKDCLDQNEFWQWRKESFPEIEGCPSAD